MRKIYFKGTVSELRTWLAYLIEIHGSDQLINQMYEHKSIYTNGGVQ